MWEGGWKNNWIGQLLIYTQYSVISNKHKTGNKIFIDMK